MMNHILGVKCAHACVVWRLEMQSALTEEKPSKRNPNNLGPRQPLHTLRSKKCLQSIKCIYICVVWQPLTASTEEKSRKNIQKTWDPNSFYRRFSNIWKDTHSDARFAFSTDSSLVEKRAVSTRNCLSLVIQVWASFYFLFYRLSGTPVVSQIPSEAFLPPLAARATVTLTHSSFSKLVKREEKTNIHTFLHIHVNI